MKKKLFSILLCCNLNIGYTQTSAEACTAIKSPVLRLACFDEFFQTPAYQTKSAYHATNDRLPNNVRHILNLKNTNNTIADHFRVSHSDDKIEIALPSDSESKLSPTMFFGCVDNITYFQVALKQPIQEKFLKVNVLDTLNGETLFSARWQVGEQGHLLDIGRGLFAIEKIKKILNVSTITYQIPSLKYYWRFNITNLKDHIKPLRKSCGW